MSVVGRMRRRSPKGRGAVMEEPAVRRSGVIAQGCAALAPNSSCVVLTDRSGAAGGLHHRADAGCDGERLLVQRRP